MKFAIAQRKFEKAESKFSDELIKEVERLARLVIETHPKAKSFCMAMGQAFFNCQWREFEVGSDDELEFYDLDEDLEANELVDSNCYASDLSDLLSNWDSKFCITGYPMMIKRDSVTDELITKTDW